MSTVAPRITILVENLIKLPRETEWVEFKVNNTEPQAIGEYISAIANATVLANKGHGYVIWGISDDRQVVGTDFDPYDSKRGGEELIPWLTRSLSPQIPFQFFNAYIAGQPVVVLKIGRAQSRPVAFYGIEYIRLGSYKKQLKDVPEAERALWRSFEQTPFEKRPAIDDLSEADVLPLLDYPAYFEMTSSSLPENRSQILTRLHDEGLLFQDDSLRWGITNLGAILFARKLDDFPTLKRKAVRVIAYADRGRTRTLREQIGVKGYAAGFEGLVSYVSSLVPANEVIGKALRKEVPMYPDLAIRELLANALIHQDFEITGAGPMVEIFSDRLEITNPGRPLMEVDRLLDAPPKSRNEALASLMRRFGVCEERGSGIDKVVQETEIFQLPAPEFVTSGDNMRATLFAHRKFNDMDKSDRIRACYMHASLRYVMRDYMSNASLRERFGIEQKNSAIASRLIKEAVEAELIRPYDADAGKRFMRYVPWWAKSI